MQNLTIVRVTFRDLKKEFCFPTASLASQVRSACADHFLHSKESVEQIALIDNDFEIDYEAPLFCKPVWNLEMRELKGKDEQQQQVLLPTFSLENSVADDKSRMIGVVGPRMCGKTWLVRKINQSYSADYEIIHFDYQSDILKVQTTIEDLLVARKSADRDPNKQYLLVLEDVNCLILASSSFRELILNSQYLNIKVMYTCQHMMSLPLIVRSNTNLFFFSSRCNKPDQLKSMVRQRILHITDVPELEKVFRHNASESFSWIVSNTTVNSLFRFM